jgi:hypothetical protein
MVTRTRHVPAARPGGGARSGARWLALAVLCVSLLIVTLDNTVLNVALPAVSSAPSWATWPAPPSRAAWTWA